MAREVYAGPLHKCGGKVKSWKKRWMVLKDDHTFSYYKDAAKPPLGVISLMDSSFSAREGSALDTAWPKHTKMENTLVVVTTSRIYYMWAESPEEASDWRTHLTSAREKMLQEHQYTNRLLHNNRTQSDGSALRMQATQEPSNHALKYRPKEAVTIGNASPQSVHGKFNPNAKNPKWYQKKDRRQPTKRFGGAGEGEGEGEGEAVSHLSDERGPDGELVNDLGIYSQLSESMEEGAPVINSLKDSPLEAIYDEASEASESIAKESGRGKDLTTPTGNTESEYYIEMAEGTAREAEQLQSPVSPVSVYEELGPAAGAPPQGTAHTSPSRAKSPAKTSKKNSATSQPLPPVPVAMASSAPASCSAGVYELIGEGGGRGERGGGAMYEHIPEGMPLYESIEVGNEASRTQCTDSGSEEEGGGDNGAPPPPLPPKDDHVPPPPPLPPKNIVEDEVEAPPVATGETKAVVLPPEEALYDFVKSSGQADTEEPPTVAPTVAPVVNNSHAPQNEDDVIYDQPDELEEGKDLPREGIIDGGGEVYDDVIQAQHQYHQEQAKATPTQEPPPSNEGDIHHSNSISSSSSSVGGRGSGSGQSLQDSLRPVPMPRRHRTASGASVGEGDAVGGGGGEKRQPPCSPSAQQKAEQASLPSQPSPAHSPSSSSSSSGKAHRHSPQSSVSGASVNGVGDGHQIEETSGHVESKQNQSDEKTAVQEGSGGAEGSRREHRGELECEQTSEKGMSLFQKQRRHLAHTEQEADQHRSKSTTIMREVERDPALSLQEKTLFAETLREIEYEKQQVSEERFHWERERRRFEEERRKMEGERLRLQEEIRKLQASEQQQPT